MAAAKRRTPQRTARARSRASGTRALTAAIRAPSPRKLATSQPTRRIPAAPKIFGSPASTKSVRRPVPGMARASTPRVTKTMKMLQNTTRPMTSEGSRRTPERPRAMVTPHSSARRSMARARARRLTTRAVIQPPARPTAARVSMARMPGITRASRALRFLMAAHTRSPHASVIEDHPLSAPPSTARHLCLCLGSTVKDQRSARYSVTSRNWDAQNAQ